MMFFSAGMQKTLMFFEGLPFPHLGATVLLRGASKNELAKLKNVMKTVLFASYNWRLEKSFLMDEFAQPPISKMDEFFNDSKESSPDMILNRNIADKIVFPKKIFEEESPEYTITEYKEKKSSSLPEKKVCEGENVIKNILDEKKVLTKSVEDYSDPLHSYLTGEETNDKSNSVQLSVQELPFSNKFRKALDETMLSVSPYLPFFIPYLETEIGRKCKLRSFFPSEIYYSKQFLEQSKTEMKREVEKKNNIVNKNVRHFY